MITEKYWNYVYRKWLNKFLEEFCRFLRRISWKKYWKTNLQMYYFGENPEEILAGINEGDIEEIPRSASEEILGLIIGESPCRSLEYLE